jgi:hypothetical protein
MAATGRYVQFRPRAATAAATAACRAPRAAAVVTSATAVARAGRGGLCRAPAATVSVHSRTPWWASAQKPLLRNGSRPLDGTPRASVQKPAPYSGSRPLAAAPVRECTETGVPTGAGAICGAAGGAAAPATVAAPGARWPRGLPRRLRRRPKPASAGSAGRRGRRRRPKPASAGSAGRRGGGRAPCSHGFRALAHPPVGDCTETAITQRFASTRRHPPGRVCRNRHHIAVRVHSPQHPCASARKPAFQRGPGAICGAAGGAAAPATVAAPGARWPRGLPRRLRRRPKPASAGYAGRRGRRRWPGPASAGSAKHLAATVSVHSLTPLWATAQKPSLRNGSRPLDGTPLGECAETGTI